MASPSAMAQSFLLGRVRGRQPPALGQEASPGAHGAGITEGYMPEASPGPCSSPGRLP